MFLDHLAWALAAFLKIFSLWFLATSIFFFLRRRPYERRAPKTRFACLIPARNEEAVIGALVRSLTEQDYPAALRDIYVIPNNCADGTEAAALAAGARILNCADPVRCKGDALRQAVEHLLPLGYDAFCVLDADNVARPDFLSRLNDAFCAGARVAKARTVAKNPKDSWVAGCYALYYGMFETFYNRSRAVLGLSAKLVGTGFAVHREVFERLGGWSTVTIAEDAEFAAVCATIGERVCWVPEAVTYDEVPRSFRVSVTQRRRWVSGVMSVAERKVPALLRALPAVNKARTADITFFLCAPFAQACSVVPPLLLLLSALGRGALPAYLAALPLSLAGGWLGMTLFAAVISSRLGRPHRPKLRSLLLFPLFMASWLPLQIVSLLRRTTGWREIRHGAPGKQKPLAPLLPDRG